jgi:hypothetical protein
MSALGQNRKSSKQQMFSDLLPKADFNQPFSAARSTGRLSSGSDAGLDAARFSRAHSHRAPRSRFGATHP